MHARLREHIEAQGLAVWQDPAQAPNPVLHRAGLHRRRCARTSARHISHSSRVLAVSPDGP